MSIRVRSVHVAGEVYLDLSRLNEPGKSGF